MTFGEGMGGGLSGVSGRLSVYVVHFQGIFYHNS
jgi:hypothetical protein